MSLQVGFPGFSKDSTERRISTNPGPASHHFRNSCSCTFLSPPSCSQASAMRTGVAGTPSRSRTRPRSALEIKSPVLCLLICLNRASMLTGPSLLELVFVHSLTIRVSSLAPVLLRDRAMLDTPGQRSCTCVLATFTMVGGRGASRKGVTTRDCDGLDCQSWSLTATTRMRQGSPGSRAFTQESPNLVTKRGLHSSPTRDTHFSTLYMIWVRSGSAQGRATRPDKIQQTVSQVKREDPSSSSRMQKRCFNFFARAASFLLGPGATVTAPPG
mmetsp:Transcript_29549/g.86175  ORF Transcript_29549/g.86175 Transcript_29549/m.86175 type:complete len:271 (-) Transcript_29549:359-1171(-)